jgi:hypothetical protein
MSGLADLLAGAGQVYGGYSEAEAAAQRMRQARLAEESAAMRLGRERRQDDYDQNVSAGLSDFLPGGSQATTVMTPGEGAVLPATPVDDEGNAMSVDLGKAVPVQTENRMGALEFMQRAAYDAGLPDKAEAHRKRADAFRSEGLEDTAKAILSGGTNDEIRDAFNRQGKIKFSSVHRIPGSETAVIAITEDGKTTHFDAGNMRKALLGGKDYFANEDRETKRSNDQREQARRDAETEALVGYRKALGSAATTRANRTGSPKPPNPATERSERRKFSTEARRYATDLAVNAEGKVDREMASNIAGLASIMVDEDPELLRDPLAAAKAAHAKYEELQQKVTAKAEREWSASARSPRASMFGFDENPDPEGFEGISRPDGTKEDKETYIARRAQQLINTLMRGLHAGETMQGAPAAARPAPKPPAKYPDAKLAPDGKWYVTKNGKHYLVTED